MRIDHTTIKEGGPDAVAPGKKTSLRWWLEEGPAVAEGITATLDSMRARQSARLLQHTIAARLYGNQALLSTRSIPTGRAAAQSPLIKDRISYNAVQSAIDTVTSKIAKNKPKPLFLTSGGDYKLQRKAKKLNRFVEGVFYENKAHRLGVKIFRDAAVFGDGLIHVFAENGRVKFERVLGSELWADDEEGFYGEPRQLHRTKNVDRAVLLDLVRVWAKDTKKTKAETAVLERLVEEADPVTPENRGEAQSVSDQVCVRESWRLPDGPDARPDDPKNGLHVISVEKGVLISEPYTKPFFPFARLAWSERLAGYWSQGGAEQVQNLQLEINKLLWVIQRSFHLAGSYKVFVENASKVVNEQINNDIGAIVRYTGTKPEYYVPQIIPPEIFNHLITLKSAVYEQLGVSTLSATSTKPSGLNSGKALREFNDIESDRFMTIGQAYEEFFVDLARLAIAVVQDIAGTRGSYKVKSPNAHKAVLELDWKDCAIKEDDYVLQAFPISSLPNEPAGRLETIQEWVQAGWITPRQGRRLMDFPDLELAEGLANAAEDYLTMVLDEMIDEGKAVAPEPYDDLKLARELALEYYQRGKAQRLEEDRLELLRRFLQQIDYIETQAAAKAAAAQAALNPPPTPQAAPLPAPTSPLIANQPGLGGAAPGLPAAA